MKLTDKVQGDVVIFTLKGNVMGGPDATLIHDKIHDYLDTNKKKFVFNLSKVEWMNATGLGILISAVTTMRNNGGEMKICCPSEKIESLLTMTKLIDIFENFKTENEAINSFK